MAEEEQQPVFADGLFRQKRKHGKFRLVEPPRLAGPVVDTHAHVHLLADPALEFARCAAWGVDFVCDIIDVQEDAPDVFDCIGDWYAQAQSRLPEAVERTREVLAAGGDELTHLPDGADAACFALPEDAASRPLPRLRLAAGVHPHNARFYDDAMESRLVKRLADPRICAVGEIGLDYHYDLSPRDDQRRAFRRQIRLAHATGLPAALHVREAHDEAFAILREEGFPEAGTLLHCFDLDWETLEPWVDRGCFVALGGALTFKRCQDTRDAVARTPADRDGRALHDARAHARHAVRPRAHRVHRGVHGRGARVRNREGQKRDAGSNRAKRARIVGPPTHTLADRTCANRRN